MYVSLLDWWVGENHRDRHVWPGNSANRIHAQGGRAPEEIETQIHATREQPGASGNVSNK